MAQPFDPYRAGSPAGSRSGSDEDLLDDWRHKSYPAALPWAHEKAEECANCARTNTGCKEHALLVPKAVIPGGPGPNDDLPCVGRWDLFDTEYPTQEALDMCASCPFQKWCGTTATANDEWFTWGGTTHADRQQPKQRKQETAA